MSFKFAVVPCLSDNYAYLVHGNGKTALIDAPEAGPIKKALAAHNWTLDEIWITHHHSDHIDAVEDLRAGTIVRGARADAHRLPSLDVAHEDGDTFDFAGSEVKVLDVSGHTVGHIAFYIPDESAVFTADSLMALGCGRVLEGTFDQMWGSLSKLAALPPETLIYSGHEYTEANGRFALTVEPNNQALLNRIEAVKEARSKDEPTVPSQLSDELATNPFLRAGLAELKSRLNMSNADDAAVFAEIRRRKDSF